MRRPQNLKWSSSLFWNGEFCGLLAIIQLYHSLKLFWIISLFAHIILWNLDFDMASNGRCVFEGGKLPPSSLGRVCLCNWLWGNPVFGRFSMACVSRFVLLVLIGGNKGLSIIGLPGSDSSTMQKNKYAY